MKIASFHNEEQLSLVFMRFNFFLIRLLLKCSVVAFLTTLHLECDDKFRGNFRNLEDTSGSSRVALLRNNMQHSLHISFLDQNGKCDFSTRIHF